MLKSRCCVLLGDLRLLLLGPPAPAPPRTPMSGQAAQSREPPDVAEQGERGTPPGAAAAERAVPGWVDAAELSAALRGCSSSSDDCSKGKLEERFSLTSFTGSGFRTPVCRICFQGPEHWQAISLTVIEKVQIAAAILGSLFLMASISWLVWSSFSPSARWQRQDLLFQICYGMYGFMDVVCIALIVHEGPSVFRIFHRWQAVNQQWKVLNYDKSLDNVDLKNMAVDRTHQTNQAYQTGLGVSASTSSLMVVASTAAGSTSANVVAAAGGLGVQDLNPDGGGAVADPHYPYNILHLLSHLRPSEPRNQASSNTRELVMRVTTV
ncbi:membrane associated ring-CH-type finger 4b [Entelurus aequoreus]|uniref:membrane associated ring-CH-type finger 4b n=1 Tax=Entelurus aequoreus TaxID=161455 RepID=UPI002B1E33B3|nr:membrane associated ring-CH-type finger 4b [Entelurus aequoreus]